MCISIVPPPSLPSLKEVPRRRFDSRCFSSSPVAEWGLSKAQALLSIHACGSESMFGARRGRGSHAGFSEVVGHLSALVLLPICARHRGRMPSPQLTASPLRSGDEPLHSCFVIRSGWLSIKLRAVILLRVLTSDSWVSQSCNLHRLINFGLLN